MKLCYKVLAIGDSGYQRFANSSLGYIIVKKVNRRKHERACRF